MHRRFGGGRLTSSSHRVHLKFTSNSLRVHSEFTSISLLDSTSSPYHFHFTSIPLSMWFRCCFDFTSIVFPFRLDVTSSPLRFHIDPTSMSHPCRCDFTLTKSNITTNNITQELPWVVPRFCKCAMGCVKRANSIGQVQSDYCVYCSGGVCDCGCWGCLRPDEDKIFKSLLEEEDLLFLEDREPTIEESSITAASFRDRKKG